MLIAEQLAVFTSLVFIHDWLDLDILGIEAARAAYRARQARAAAHGRRPLWRCLIQLAAGVVGFWVLTIPFSPLNTVLALRKTGHRGLRARDVCTLLAAVVFATAYWVAANRLIFRHVWNSLRLFIGGFIR
ncbi:MAG: hypothetical protein KGI59_02175 [Patescibacteria group bacterium]|nr:hypothetical protein [Patescibacteria group bacterium]MDE2172399.1 hypothetical protein [Patescibacteria group bacterium]